MSAHRVGGEVDAFCTRCGLLLAHTVLAMVGPKIARVQCNTCKAPHVYRSAGEKRPSTGDVASHRRPATVVVTFEQKLLAMDPARKRPYGTSERFQVDDLLEHPAFGTGIVVAEKGPQKIEVMFRTDVKVLLHNRGPATR